MSESSIAFVSGAVAAVGSSVVKVPLAVCIRSVQAGVYPNFYAAAKSIVDKAGMQGLFTVRRKGGGGRDGGWEQRTKEASTACHCPLWAPSLLAVPSLSSSSPAHYAPIPSSWLAPLTSIPLLGFSWYLGSQGFLPTLLEDVPDMAVKFTVYESLRTVHAKLRDDAVRRWRGGRQA
jgi:hypothetical protein